MGNLSAEGICMIENVPNELLHLSYEISRQNVKVFVGS